MDSREEGLGSKLLITRGKLEDHSIIGKQRRAIATIRDGRGRRYTNVHFRGSIGDRIGQADEQRGCTGAMLLVNNAEMSPAGGQKTHN